MESFCGLLPLIIFFGSGIAKWDQFVEVNIFPIHHFVDQALGEDWQALCNKHLFGGLLLVKVGFQNVDPGFFKAGLLAGCVS